MRAAKDVGFPKKPGCELGMKDMEELTGGDAFQKKQRLKRSCGTEEQTVV